MNTKLSASNPALPAALVLDAPALVVSPAKFAVISRLSTPGRLWLLAALICLGALALSATSASALRQARAGLQSVGQDCAPSIIASQRIRAALADLDANLVNQLIVAPGSSDMASAVKTVAQRRDEIADNLVRAAENITFGDAERAPITAIARNLGSYEALLARAKGLQEKGDFEGALRAEREGESLLHQTLIPAADALDLANTAALDKAYAEARTANGLRVALVMISGGALAVCLILTQGWLTYRMRRLLNPALALATVLTVGFTIWTSTALLRSSEFLRAATDDAFASVHYLWKARAISYDGNAAESRWLLDQAPGPADAAQRLFEDSAARIARLPEGKTFTQLVGSYRAMADPLKPVSGFEGLLAQELGNITFPGERQAATDTLQAWGVYFEIDAAIRRLERSGDHKAAIALCLSYEPNGSNGAFEKFHAALTQTLDINQHAFEASLGNGFVTLYGLDSAAPMIALLISGLGVAGLWARVREYHA